MIVQQILNAKDGEAVVSISPETLVSEAARLLSERRIGAVVISPDGVEALGILSERDIVRKLGRSGPSCLDERVETLMTRDLISCTRQETSDEVLQKMTSGRFRHMPVIEAGKMIGIISIGDVVKAQLSTLAMEKEALEGMIKGF